jgi:hypothetical protein
MFGRALSEVAHVLNIGARRIHTATDDGVATCVRIIGAVEKLADGLIGP